MSRPLLLDLFCGAGGAAMDYHRAGFDVVGVDIKPQPRYPFEFIQADALEFLQWNVLAPIVPRRYDAAHASPPCQGYSVTQNIWGREYPMLIDSVRETLQQARLPYVIENVCGAPLREPLMLCGTMFGLRTYRHRLFESNAFLMSMPHGKHHAKTEQVGRRPKPDEYMTVAGHFGSASLGREIMGISWMTRDELAQAIPPAYTEFIGRQLMRHLAVPS